MCALGAVLLDFTPGAFFHCLSHPHVFARLHDGVNISPSESCRVKIRGGREMGSTEKKNGSFIKYTTYYMAENFFLYIALNSGRDSVNCSLANKYT